MTTSNFASSIDPVLKIGSIPLGTGPGPHQTWTAQAIKIGWRRSSGCISSSGYVAIQETDKAMALAVHGFGEIRPLELGEEHGYHLVDERLK